MRHMKKAVWGIVLILVGVVMALCALGVIPLPTGISPWRILVGVGVGFILIEGLLDLNFAQAFLMAGILFMIFEESIGALIGKSEANWMSNLVVILIALLVGAGFDMIFGGLKRRFKEKRKKGFGVNVHAFSDNLKYIDASKMNKEYVSNRFGDFEIRFENVDDYSGGGELTIDNSFGDVVVYVPSDWEVEVDVDNSFGDITVDGALRVIYADGSSKKLLIKGTNRFGDMDIKAHR